MKIKLVLVAVALVILGVVGFLLISKLTMKSSIEQIEPQWYRVKLHKSDGYFNTGLTMPRPALIQINSDPEGGVQWIAKINEVPHSANSNQMIQVCPPPEEMPDFQKNCIQTPKSGSLLLIKNDSNKDEITLKLYVEASKIVPIEIIK